MDNRLELQSRLETIIGNRNVYFQPPASVKLLYPCVIYSIGNGDAKRANNTLYLYTHSYDVIFVFNKPNIEIIETVLSEFSMCRLASSYCSDNLNHYVFNLYF